MELVCPAPGNESWPPGNPPGIVERAVVHHDRAGHIFELLRTAPARGPELAARRRNRKNVRPKASPSVDSFSPRDYKFCASGKIRNGPCRARWNRDNSRINTSLSFGVVHTSPIRVPVVLPIRFRREKAPLPAAVLEFFASRVPPHGSVI